MPALPGRGLPVGPAFAQRFFQFIALQVQRAKLILLHIRKRGVADVVHYDVKQNADTALVRLVDQVAEIVFAAHVGVEFCPVLRVVAVIGIVREIAFGAAANPAVNLLQRRANPQGVDAKLLEIIELSGESFKIAAVEGANFLHAIFVAAIAVVIRRIAIHEAVSQHKVDGGVLPAEWRGFVGFCPFKQEQTVTVRGGLQGDFPLLYGGRLLTVEIPYHGAFRESVFHLDGERFTVPFRALASDLCDGFICVTLHRQHQRWRA
ncbi:hypothetical protein D3C72_1261230 [compost metagenome]